MPLSAATGLVAPWSRLRLRQSEHLRDLCAEISFTTAHLIQPIFIVEGLGASEPITGLDGNARLGLAEGLDTIARDLEAGVRHFLLFAVPSRAGSPIAHGIFAAQAVEAITRRFGARLCLWVDICVLEHRRCHCAIADERGQIDLTATLAALGMTVRVADAGADGVSPSDMMDGRTAWMRRSLDDRGHGAVPIMSYSTKFASHFYGPFREAAGSAPRHGNRAHYQIDVRSRTDAIGSSIRCANEGADLLMVKPGITSLDLIAPIREATGRLVGAYHVSGEYAGLCALGREGLPDTASALLATRYVFRPAGAAFTVTYGARR